MIEFLFGTDKAVRVGNTEIREVKCEKCGGEFCYLMRREAEGEQLAPFYLGGGWAKRKAEKIALAKLAAMMAGVELVRCPDCGILQEAMVKEWRIRRVRVWSVYVGVFWFLGTVGGIYWQSRLSYRFARSGQLDGANLCAGLVGFVIVWWLMQKYWRWSGRMPRFSDPNDRRLWERVPGKKGVAAFRVVEGRAVEVVERWR